MAATGTSASELTHKPAANRSVQRVHRNRGAWRILPLSATVLSAFLGTRSFAERVQLDIAVSSEVTATNNSLLSAEVPESDVIVSVKPRFLLLAEGARLRLTGAGSFNMLGYVNKTQKSGVLPDFEINATGIAIERVLNIEAGARVSQVFDNPFGLRADPGTTTENKITTTQYRLSPVVDMQSGNGLRFTARSDNILLDDDSENASTSGPTATGYFGHHNVVFEQTPRPLGWRAELDRTDTRYENAQSALVSDVARLGINRAFDGTLSLGFHLGAERNNFVTGDNTSEVYGIDLNWKPTERTNLDMFVEHRYFGTGGRIVFDHRMPWLAWNALISRGIVTTPQTLFSLGPTDDVAGLLNQIYTTRFPDPIERSRQVQEIIARAGLPSSLTQTMTVYSQRISLESVASFRVAYIGTRNSLALSASWTRLEDAPDTGALATGLAINNNTQRFVALTGSRRLTPQVTASLSLGWNTIKSLLTASSDQATTERSLEARVGVNLAPRTTGYFGARYREFVQDNSATPSTNNNETAAFVGIDHRF
jgi:uncharacterized protein (PEP-CTERM system associated)